MSSPATFLLLMALSGSAAPDQPVPAITREQALSLPPAEVADIIFDQVAASVGSMTRPNYVSPFLPGVPLTDLQVATRPRRTDFQGLCRATVISVTFLEGVQAEHFRPDGDRNAPVRVREISVREVYKINGEVDSTGSLDRDELDRWERSCAQLDGVIAPEQRMLGYRSFFGFSGPLGPAHGAHILQRFVRDVRDGSHSDHRCLPAYMGCRESGPVLRSLSLDDLVAMRIERVGETSEYVVHGRFLESGDSDSQTLLQIAIRVELGDMPTYDIRRFGPATIERSVIVRD